MNLRTSTGFTVLRRNGRRPVGDALGHEGRITGVEKGVGSPTAVGTSDVGARAYPPTSAVLNPTARPSRSRSGNASAASVSAGLRRSRPARAEPSPLQALRRVERAPASPSSGKELEQREVVVLTTEGSYRDSATSITVRWSRCGRSFPRRRKPPRQQAGLDPGQPRRLCSAARACPPWAAVTSRPGRTCSGPSPQHDRWLRKHDRGLDRLFWNAPAPGGFGARPAD